MTILVELLGLRRAGMPAPTLGELRRQLSSAALDEPAFLRDLLQLEDWGCLTRELEHQSIRGYRDARRERFRHRLTEDVVALLEWLEARVARGTLPLHVDASDRLLDVLGRARELARLTEAPHVEGAHRVQHLIRSLDTELDAITRCLVDLHAEMRRFAARAFEPGALARVVAGLEAYVAGFLGSVDGRRGDLRDAVARLTDTEVRERLTVLAHAAATSASPFSSKDADESSVAQSLSRWSVFFEDGGDLDAHCAQIEVATHDVIAKLRDRLATLERRGDRGHERVCAIRTLASIDDTRDGALAMWGFRTPMWAPGDGARLFPPLPRRKTRPRLEEPRALPVKRAYREVAREPRQARMLRVLEWLREAGLTEGAVQLSDARHDALRGAQAPDAWMAIARAQHLARGARLSELGVHIEPSGGVVTVGNDTVGLASPDCIVRSDDSGRDREQRRRV